MLASLLVYFILPHVTNNHKAKLIQPIMIAILVVVFLLSQLILPFIPRFTPIVLSAVSDISPEEIIDLTNKEREAVGAPSLEADHALTQAALSKASYMLAKNFWAHTAPDGTEPWKFVTDSGYQYRYAGENLARDFANSGNVVRAWMNSPSHKDNLLSNRYQNIGVAVVKGELDGVQTTLVVQFFGTKMSSSNVAGAEIKPTINTPQITNIAGVAKEKLISISPYLATKNIAFFLISLLFLIFSIDMVVVNSRNTQRVSSKSFAHSLFLGVIMLVIFVSQGGVIL